MTYHKNKELENKIIKHVLRNKVKNIEIVPFTLSMMIFKYIFFMFKKILNISNFRIDITQS